MSQNPRLLLLDGNALIYRAYYAMMRAPRVTTTGIDTSATYGFVITLQDLLKRMRPSHIAVCLDPSGHNTFRHEAYPEYKANRDKAPEGVIQAKTYLTPILEAYKIPLYVVDGFEADDVIGTLAHEAGNQDFETYMVTGDKDFGQLVTDRVKILHPGKYEVLGVDEIKEKYGLQSPLQVIDLLGLMGDTADNIPGCPGVGPKTAEKLIQQFGSIENMLEHTDEIKGTLRTKVEENAEQIKFSKFLATIRTDVPLAFDAHEMERQPADLKALAEVFKTLEFRQLAERLITKREANVGLEQEATATASGGQLSLFDDMGNAAAPAQVIDRDNIKRVTHDYRTVTDTYEAEQMVTQLLERDQLAITLLADGEEAMRATPVGLAVATEPHHAVYFPLDAMGFMMQSIQPLFAGKTRLVANDVKRIIVMLAARDIAFTAPYYDTSVAHYLLQPERGHDTRAIADELLNYDTIDWNTATGTRNRARQRFSALALERQMELACEDADVNISLPALLDERIAQLGVAHLLNDIELPLVDVLAQMEIAGARIDVKALNDYSVTLSSQIEGLEQECYALAGTTFNTASPAQVGEILFDRLKLDEKARKTKTGQYATTEEILLRIRHRHPIVDKILQLRGVRKLLSTYVNALPALINPRTGRIHTTYNQTVTATGRLSSTNPNLQNIPVRTDDGREIRRAFIPAEGNLFFSADYSQIELRLVADLSGDQTMIDAFAHDHDIHAITAARIYHKAVDEVTPDERRKAKTANFGILYGISAFGLAQRLNIRRDEAKMLIDGYYETFPQVRDYIDRCIEQARQQGYVTTVLGRRRMLPDINSRNAVVRSFSERNAINAPIQGTAADVIKIAMVAIARRFKQEGIRSRMILQVHDELNFDLIPSEREAVECIVVEEMENAYHGRVRLTASHGCATNWLDAH